MKDIVVIGCGGFSKQVIEIIEEINDIKMQYNLIGLIDDNEKLLDSYVLGYKVIGNMKYLNKYSIDNNICGVIAIANPSVRQRIAEKLVKIKWINLIHPKAIISKYAKIGVGNIICAGTIINPNFTIGDHCHINIGCTLGHDITVREYVTLMPGCRISGNVVLKSKSTIGSGAVILQGLLVEEDVIIGAAALLNRNTIKGNTYIGIPARGKLN